MTTMICMRGYSGSGKSTQAQIIADELQGIRVCRDDIRFMLLGKYWTGIKADEERVSVVEKAAVMAAINDKLPVIIDATHLEPRYLRAWAKLAGLHGYSFKVADVKASVDTCIHRDSDRNRSVGAQVIKNQAKRHPMNSWPTIEAYGPVVEPYVPLHGSVSAVMCDLDGTLAINTSGRSPYVYDRVEEDTVDPVVKELLAHHKNIGDLVILCSGRDDSCKPETERWLKANNITWDELHMRAPEKGQKRPDWWVKLELFDDNIRQKYDIKVVYDDRKQVVDIWRRIGLRVFQVAPGNF